MSKEAYLQVKKEFLMRFAFNVGIAGIGIVLLIVMILNQSRYIPYLLVVIGAFFAMYRPTLQAQKEQEEKVEIRQKLQPAVENIQKQEQSSREAVQSQMKDLLRTPSSSSETEATSGE